MTETDKEFDLKRCYAVTRHPGAAAWLRARVPEATVIPHLDPALVRPGDTVIGILPVNLAAAVVARGAKFQDVVLNLPPEARGRELSPEEMDRYGAHVAPYEVWPARVIAGWRVPSLGSLWRRMSSRSWRGHSVLLIVLAGLVAPNLLSQALWEVRPLWSAALALATAGAVYGLYAWRHSVLSSRIKRLPAVPQRRVLIMGLSPLPVGERRDAALHALAFAETLRLETLALTNSEITKRRHALESAARPDEKESLEAYRTLGQHIDGQLFRWQQNVRAIRAHLPHLQAIIVLTSPQSQPDFPVFDQFIRVVLYGSGHPQVLIRPLIESVADFEDYEQLKAAFAAAQGVARDWNARPRDLCIDVTAGQKIFSIAAAIATLNSGTVFSYVNNDGAVTVFDASIELTEE